MDPIQKVIEEEKTKLAGESKTQQEEYERRKREEYENHPDTIMQNEMRELLPIIIGTLENFSRSANAICINFYRLPKYPPPEDHLAMYNIFTKKGLVFKKPDLQIAKVVVGIRRGAVIYQENRFLNSCRLAILQESREERVEYNALPEKDKLEEWLVRELAKFYARLGTK